MTVARTTGELEAVVAEWWELADAVAEPNAFYEPFMLLPAIAELAGGGDIRVLLLRTPEGALVGVVPVQRHAASLAIPVPHFSLWRHRYCFLCTPLLAAGYEERAVEAMFDWLGRQGAAGRVLRLSGHVRDGPFGRATKAFTRGGHHFLRTTDSYERAFLAGGTEPEAYLRAALTPKRSSELRRKRNRLGDLGHVDVVSAVGGQQLEGWIPRFLDLEHRGWKGRAGSSMAALPSDHAFLLAVARGGRETHRADLLSITLNGAPVAIGLTVRTGPAVFAFKIAYDEVHAHYSPGVLLAVEYLRRILSDSSIAWADSCADPSHPMLDSLWVQRRPIEEVIVARDSLWTRLACGIGSRLQRWNRSARAWVRGLPAPVQRHLRWIQALLRG